MSQTEPVPDLSAPVCPDCGEPMAKHCVVWTSDDMFVQCQATSSASDEEQRS